MPRWIVLLLFVGMSLPASAQATRPARPPNIVFMLIDDMGYGELGCFGNTFNETPRIDAFAKTALRFRQAYAQPVCSPTRVSIMTGQYPHRSGVEDFLDPQSKVYLDPNQHVTINRVLRSAGYHSGIIGKWHLDTHFNHRLGGPKENGFDEVIGSETRYIADGDYFFPYDKIDTITTGQPDEFLPDRLSDEAVHYIERNAAGMQPFFLYYAEYAVHTRLDAPPPLVRKYHEKFESQHGPGSAAKFDAPDHLGKPDNIYMAAMLERVDNGFGKILDALDRLGIADNTVVLLMSDNGGDGRVANNGGLRAGKGHLYEGGIRVDQLVRWPGVTQAGTDTDVPTLAIDYYPTLAEIAGAKLPTAQIVDGESFVPVLRGDTSWKRQQPIFWHYPANTAPWPMRAGAAVRDGHYKLIQLYHDRHFELYDLASDPTEQHDLKSEEPNKFDQLKAELTDWRKSMGIALPPTRGNPPSTNR